MFGSHLSIAGGLHHALLAARELAMDCVQVFTKNQRQWKVKPLTDQEVRLWQQHRRDTGIEHVVSHDSYLINLASPDDGAWEKSIALFRDELLRCEALDIGHLVTHPGAHMKMGEAYGLARVSAALDRLHAELPGLKVVTCLEITAGQGSSLGYRLEHLRQIIDAVKQPQRLAVCLDTAHLLAAGYDLTSAAGAKIVLQQVQAVLGLDRVRVIHVNDSKVNLGGRVDRHEHIGSGYVSLAAFEVLVNEPGFQEVPKILETPKGLAENGTAWDTINLKKLQDLRKKRRTPARKPPAEKPASKR
jgi:deoxyribonuclease IV